MNQNVKILRNGRGNTIARFDRTNGVIYIDAIPIHLKKILRFIKECGSVSHGIRSIWTAYRTGCALDNEVRDRLWNF